MYLPAVLNSFWSIKPPLLLALAINFIGREHLTRRNKSIVMKQTVNTQSTFVKMPLSRVAHFNITSLNEFIWNISSMEAQMSLASNVSGSRFL